MNAYYASSLRISKATKFAQFQRNWDVQQFKAKNPRDANQALEYYSGSAINRLLEEDEQSQHIS